MPFIVMIDDYYLGKATYTTYTEVCGHPFKLVDSAISATPIADGYKIEHTAV